MDTVTTIADLRQHVRAARGRGLRIGFVPTMGNLHAGHESLVALARERAGFVVASVFVNPTQFGPNEDFARYPRTPEQDAEKLARVGCDLLFLPDVATLYPLGTGRAVRMSVPGITEVLDGASRPGHFDGVATVVARLFNLVQPDLAVFGRNDYQQWLVVRALVADLGFPIDIVGAPIVREPGGLAMSSRNQYLDEAQRRQAQVLHATLQWMVGEVRTRPSAWRLIEEEAVARLGAAGFEPDYAVLRDAATLDLPDSGFPTGGVALLAARLAGVRLIDNLEFDRP